MDNMETTLKRRLSDEYSLRSSDNDVEDVPADVAAFRDMQNHGFPPNHETGHSTPGHIVGKPIHDSPKHVHHEIPAETPAIHTRTSQFQEAVSKIIESKSTGESAETLVEPLQRVPGSEPGIDPRRESVKRAYAYIHEECEVEVIDYNSEHVKFQQFNNDSFLRFLEKTERCPPMKVRWINVAGISWDIISALALKYQLHPLSIEDILHSRSTTRSKADYYQRHLFLSVLCHAVTSKKSSPLDPKYFLDQPAESESESEEDETESEDGNQNDDMPEEDTKKTLLRRVTRRGRRRRSRTLDSEAKAGERHTPLKWTETMAFLNPETRKRQGQLAKLNALKKRDRVRVLVSNAFFFMFKDGTLISIHQGDRSFGNQIYHRLRHADTVLRKDPDVSLLLQALLDLIVDQAIQVVEKYSDKINETETQVLLKPNMNIVRTLHILSADLTLRKRTMQPLKPLIWGLRKFDLERTAAALGVENQGPVVGFMSPKTKIYLSDVSDHLETILSSLDQFATIADNLIDLTFNMNAHNTNEQMKRMTILMIVFLPLTFATGYFGMNFDPFPAVREHSDALFWQIVLPVMAVVVPWALWADITRMFRRIGSMRLLSRVEQKQNAKAKTAQRHERVLRRRSMAMKEKEKEA